ncbi:class I SAM-dependent RNA methyltransferase [Desulfocurvibacter africanus]|uniref:class I SAM-dependent RNA methyltransferase n=1 Tax=Desulfocurvibacter africanus TaxID=873 RepID=UPI00040C65AB|nr:class I SAM-dependent RNA methyltransferase [Desulfocurvibacter africanus]
MTQELRSGDVLELDIEKLTCGGRGLARLQGRAVFVERGLPGQLVRARLSKLAKRHAEAATVEVLRSSPEQIEPFCPHYADCGGCDWQDLDYAAQLRWKRQIVAESLRHIGRQSGESGQSGQDVQDLVNETTPSPLLRGFRNKMEFAFAGRELQVGLRSWRDPRMVLDVTACGLMADPAMAVLAAVREMARAGSAAVFDPATGRGVWRFLVLRDSRPAEANALRTGEGVALPRPLPPGADAPLDPRSSVLGCRGEAELTCAAGLQAILITGPGNEAAKQAAIMAQGLLERFPGLSVAHGVRRDKAAVAYAEEIVRAWGDPVLEMSLGGLRYRLSPQAFFQTNTAGAERLFGLVEEMAGLSDWPIDAEVFDCYCGVGAMALRLARAAGHVTGFELVEGAVRDATDNARLNNLTNCSFVAGDLRRTLADRKLPKPDVLVIDPPRAGMHPDVAARILDLAPERIVSVSCDPATFARDAALLLPGYSLARVVPVDLFPHNHHVETVALLVRRT